MPSKCSVCVLSLPASCVPFPSEARAVPSGLPGPPPMSAPGSSLAAPLGLSQAGLPGRSLPRVRSLYWPTALPAPEDSRFLPRKWLLRGHVLSPDPSSPTA